MTPKQHTDRLTTDALRMFLAAIVTAGDLVVDDRALREVDEHYEFTRTNDSANGRVIFRAHRLPAAAPTTETEHDG